MAATDRATASLTVGYEIEAIDLALALEMHRGPYSEYGSIPIRLYPNVPAIVRATRGSAHLGEARSEAVEEILDFGGGKTARLKRPNPTGLVFESLQLAFDAAGHEVFPTLHYDAERGEVVADLAFHGAFKVKYTTDYRLIYYRYGVDYQPFGATVLNSGIVYAFYLNASAKIEVGIDGGQELWQTELYRVYSNVVLDPEGAWEEPPGWNASPRDGSYPSHPSIDPRDPDNSFTDERKHRIGYINRLGTVSWAWFFAPTLQPETGSTTYRPKYKLKWGTPPDESWAGAFNQVNKSQIKADLAVSFPGLADG